MKPHRNNGRACAKCNGLCEYDRSGKRFASKVRLLRATVDEQLRFLEALNLADNFQYDNAEATLSLTA